jgi:hypothetical protein
MVPVIILRLSCGFSSVYYNWRLPNVVLLLIVENKILFRARVCGSSVQTVRSLYRYRYKAGVVLVPTAGALKCTVESIVLPGY